MLTRYLTSFTLFVALILFPLSPVAASDIRFIDVASVNWTGSKAFTATVSQVESSIRDEGGRDTQASMQLTLQPQLLRL